MAIWAPRSAPRRRCWPEIARYFPATLELATIATIIGTLIGVPAGVLAATKPGSILDQLVRLIGLMGYSMPVFWLGLMGLLLFYGILGWVGGPGRLDAAFDMMMQFEVTAHTGMILIDTALSGKWDMFGNAVSHIILPASLLGYLSHGLYQPHDPFFHDERTGAGIHHHGPRQGHAGAAGDLGPCAEERHGAADHRGRAVLFRSCWRGRC